MRRYRRRGLRLRLRKETVYTIFGFGFILAGLLFLLSFSKSGDSFVIFQNILSRTFGLTSVLFPISLILFGFLFLRLKFFLSRLNVALGFLIIFFSLTVIVKGGSVGREMSLIFTEILNPLGTFLVFLIGLFVGIVIMFNTSVDEIIQGFFFLLKNSNRLLPNKIFSIFKTKKSLVVKDKGMTIKGALNEKTAVSSKTSGIQIVKKEPVILSEKLVTNITGVDGIWEYPPLSLLSDSPGQKANRGDINKTASIIEKTLQSFGIAAKVVEVNLGPAVTQYALEIALGTKVSKITSLSNDLALATEAPTGQIRIEAPIPGRNLVGIEIPNRSLEIVTLKTMLSSSVLQKSKSKLTVSLGLDVSGEPLVVDIAKMPHVLIAGTTGSGKSVLINSFISSLLFRGSPSEVKLILIDPKRVELTGYNGIPHLLTPIIVEPEKILSALKWAMGEMDRRYHKFAEMNVRNIESYNELSGFQALPYIVIFIDELADLMVFAPVKVEDAITRLAQMARATGIHLVLSTQRPSVDVLTGLIKANIPCRIAFNVSSMIDSRVILDTPGAEKLLGRGDMLYIPPNQAKPTRIQGAFVSETEVKKLVDYLKTKAPVIAYTEEVITQKVSLRKGGLLGGSDGHDDFLEEAIRVVCQYDRASASLLQRRLRVGYARAARILDELEALGIVGFGEGSKPRDVIMKDPEEIIAGLHEQ